MNAINEISLYLVQTAIGIYLLIMLMRFVLQLVLADFYNPISQFLVRATNPLVLPLRRILPARGRIDAASLLLAILIQFIGIIVVLAIFGSSLPSASLLLAWSVVGVAALLVKIYFFSLIGTIILSWIAPGTSNHAAYHMYQISEPVIAPFRRLLPAMGGIDFSPILVLIIFRVVDIALRNIAQGLQLNPILVVGI
ncbi:MAG: YggT family protein [Pseudomonadota bacterium]